MARQYPKPKSKRDDTWFRDKVLLVEAQGSGKVLNEEELAFLADLGVAEGLPRIVLRPMCLVTDQMFSPRVNKFNKFDTQYHSLFSDNLIANESLSAKLKRYKERVKLLKERQNVDLSTREKLILDDIIREKNAQFADFKKEINCLKQTLSEQSKEKKLLTKTFNVFKYKLKEKEAKNIDKEIALEKKVKELDNIIRPMLYDGSVIAKETNMISIADSEESLMLEEESRSKMFLKQSDPMVLEKKCLELEAELIKQHNMVEKDEYNRLSKSFSNFPNNNCFSIELAMQLNKEFFQKNNTTVNQTEPSFDQLFELSNLKAKLKAKDTTIKKLKANIKRLNKISTTNSVKKDIDEIETINIELEHRVTKLIAKNEHLKQIYKQLYDSIKPSREKIYVITTLKNDLRKFKRKDIVDNVAQVSNATTIAPGMYKLDPVTLAPKDKNNRETHIYYLKHTMEQAAILREIVEQAKSLNPLDSAFYSACKYVKPIQELLGYVRDTCPDIHKPSEKLVIVTPINKKKTVSSMFDARHELCFLEFVSDMNASSKSKFVKKAKNKEEWKPTGKLTTLASEQLGLGPRLQCMTLATSSSGLVPNPIPQQLCIPPPRDDWDSLFQPMFDEYFIPPTIAASLVPVAGAPRDVALADSPVSTSIDQDVPSTSIPSTQEQEHSPIISQGFEESPKIPHFHDDPLHESLHEDSTSQGSSSNVRPIYILFESLGRWTKDHPIANVIRDPSYSVSTRKQL
ncbi:hypothetical protein Tco_1172518 [Tanacetum coccineum]